MGNPFSSLPSFPSSSSSLSTLQTVTTVNPMDAQDISFDLTNETDLDVSNEPQRDTTMDSITEQKHHPVDSDQTAFSGKVEEKQRPLISDKIKQLTNTYNSMHLPDSSQLGPEQFVDLWNQTKTQILEDSVLCEKIRRELQRFAVPLSLLDKDSEDDWKPINKIGLLVVPDHSPFIMGINTLEKLYDTIVSLFPSSQTDYWIVSDTH